MTIVEKELLTQASLISVLSGIKRERTVVIMLRVDGVEYEHEITAIDVMGDKILITSE
jgi:hypothetical protein